MTILRRLRAVLVLGVLVGVGGPVQAQDQPLIAVLPFQAIEVSASIASIIATLFETNLVNTGVYSVLSQSERGQILDAQEASVSDCTDEGCAVEIGKLLAAEQIIIGTVAALGSKYIITAKIIDVSTSRTLGAENISAASVEELDIACEKLTIALVQRAMPDIAVAEAPAVEETKPEAVPEKQPEKEPEEKPETTEEKPAATEEAEAAEAETEEEAPEKEPEPAKPPRPPRERTPLVPVEGVNVIGVATLSAGMLLAEAGWLAQSISGVFKQQTDDAWIAYSLAGDNLDILYATYDDVYGQYTVSTITSYALWGGGTAAIGASLFIAPQTPLALSLPGKIAFSAGIAAAVAGNVFHAIAGTQAVQAQDLWRQYSDATDNLTELYDQYDDAYSSYQTSTIVSYALWGFGALATPASFFVPGEKTAIAQGIIPKIIMTAGMGLITGGNFVYSLAINSRDLATEAWIRYATAGDNLTALYEEYDSYYSTYRLQSLASYGLWGGGAAVVLATLFVPFDSIFPATTVASVNIVPEMAGFTVQVHTNP